MSLKEMVVKCKVSKAVQWRDPGRVVGARRLSLEMETGSGTRDRCTCYDYSARRNSMRDSMAARIDFLMSLHSVTGSWDAENAS